jgi:transcriptional regulator with XRE-family HTH domain
MVQGAAAARKAAVILAPSGPGWRVDFQGMMETVTDANCSMPAGELGAFLRACRERTTPRDVGLPDSGRRRTPGLRREEVATLAGVSVDYLVRLEQGRDIHPSGEVLVALADAMRLNEEERRHLFKLGVTSGNQVLCPAAQPLARDVPTTVQAVLDALDPTPAFVIGPIGDLLGWNRAFAMVAAGLGLLDAANGSPPNLVRFVFAHPAARRVYPEWRTTADEQVARVRRAAGHWSHDPATVALIEQLRVDTEFEVRWHAHPVAERRRGTKRMTHPEVGDLYFDFEVLELPADSELQMITWLAADAATKTRLVTLTGGPSGLRLVEGH